MTTKWRIECWACGGEGTTFDCLDGCCEDAEIGCDQCERWCDICQGKGTYTVTQLSDDNCDIAIPLD